MSKGDRVRILVDAGEGVAREFTVAAEATGRTVEVKQGTAADRGMILVSLVGRTGKVVSTSRFMSSRVVALIEERVEEEPAEAQRLTLEGQAV